MNLVQPLTFGGKEIATESFSGNGLGLPLDPSSNVDQEINEETDNEHGTDLRQTEDPGEGIGEKRLHENADGNASGILIAHPSDVDSCISENPIEVCEENKSPPNHDAEYLATLKHMGKSDKIINMLLNKRGNFDSAKQAMQQLGKYFEGNLEEFSRHLCRTYGMKPRTWPELVKNIEEELEANPLYEENRFALTAVMCELAEPSEPVQRTRRKKKR